MKFRIESGNLKDSFRVSVNSQWPLLLPPSRIDFKYLVSPFIYKHFAESHAGRAQV